jgi:hypothetical protein
VEDDRGESEHGKGEKEMRRTLRIEDNYRRGLSSKKSRFRFDVIAKRQDGMEWSVGTARTVKQAQALKRKHLWSKKDPQGKLLHRR